MTVDVIENQYPVFRNLPTRIQVSEYDIINRTVFQVDANDPDLLDRVGLHIFYIQFYVSFKIISHMLDKTLSRWDKNKSMLRKTS